MKLFSMRKTILIIFAIVATASVQAQDPHFSQFFSSPLTLNPAFTGKFDGVWRIAANHRDQWPSIPKAYVTTSASFDFGILQSKIPKGDVFGIGISGLSDQSADAALKLNFGSLSLSYHKSLDDEGYNTIGAGFQATYSSVTIDFSKLTFADQLTSAGFTQPTNDPAIANGNNRNYLDMNAGILFSGSSNGLNNYYLGASVYHINKPSLSFTDQAWNLASRLTVHAGGTLPISDVISFNPSVIYQAQNKASELVLGGALSALLNNNDRNPTYVYFGAWLRVNDAAIPYVGIEINGLRIGASYDVNTSGLKAATTSRGGSEFSVIYIHRPTEIKGIPCPRF
jgi:type IX secretion system PorP/SprF family membrane protein